MTTRSAAPELGRQGTSSTVRRRGAEAIRRVNLPGLAFLALLVVAWEVAVRGGLISYQFLPAPTEVFEGAQSLLSGGELLDAVAHTALVAVGGWILAGALGAIVGIALGLSPGLWRWTASSIELLRSFPSITFVPLAVLLLGFSYQMELVVVVYASQWPVLINTMDGVRSVSPGLREVTRTLGMSRLRSLRAVIVPAAASKMLVGLRLGLNLSLILAVAAEIVGNPEGLGYGLIFEQQALKPGRMFAYFVVIGLLGMLLNALFQLAVRRLMPGVIAATNRKG